MELRWDRRRYSKEEFIAAWQNSKSIAGVLRTLGLSVRGGNYNVAKATAEALGLSADHMAGQSWSRGINLGPKIAIETYLAKDRPTNSNRLRLRLLSDGIFDHRCVGCGLTKWHSFVLDQEIEVPLELDHINGDNCDNRIENLRLLCSNCHACTTTYRGKNKNKGA